MSSAIVLNQNNVDPTTNNTYTYTFPQPFDMTDYELALSKCNIYYSWFSISAKLNNNVYQLRIPNGASTTILTNTIPDGTYSVADLNNQLQYFMIENKLYYVNNTDGSYLYYFSIATNSTSYGVSLTCNPFPTSTPSGYTDPAGGFGTTLPLSASTGQFVILPNRFMDIIGFKNASYPSSAQSTIQTNNSTYTPQLSPIGSCLMACDAIFNEVGLNTNIIHAFTTAGKSFGNMIESTPSQLTYFPCIGYRNSITISFLTDKYQPLEIRDTNLTIMLILRKKKTSNEDDIF